MTLLLLSVPGFTAGAQRKAVSLEGTVSALEDGRTVPLGYAVLQLKPSGVYATADASGAYSFKNIDPGRYDISVQLIGYETLDTTLVLTSPMQRNFVLRPSSFRLEEVRVVAEASKAGEATASTISRQAIDHSQTSSLQDIMQLLPGVSFSNPDLSTSQTLTLRTADPSSMNSLGTAVIVDGAPMSNNANMEGISTAITGVSSSVASTGTATSSAAPNTGIDVRQISTDNIESVEVIRGIPSVQYGDLTSGAVIINSKAGAEPLTVRLKTDPKIWQAAISKGFRLPGKLGEIHLSGDYAYSNAKTTEAYANYQRANFKTMITRRFGDVNMSFSADVRYGRDIRNPNPDEERTALATGGNQLGGRIAINGTWNINKGWFKTLRFDLAASYTDKASWYENNIRGDRIYSTNMLDGEAVSNAKGRIFAADGSEITHFTEGNEAFATILPYSYFSHYDFYGKELNGFSKLTLNLYKAWGETGNRILVGADFKTDGNLGQGLVYAAEAPPSHAGNSEAGFRPRPLWDIPFLNQVGVFLEDSFRTKFWNRTMNLTAGLRYDFVNGLSALSPRVNFSFELIPSVWTLRAGYGITAKAPTTAYLYPNKAYYDQINVNTPEPNPSDPAKVVVATSYIFDTSNPALKMAKNRKAEVGFDLVIAKRYRLSMTYYDEELKNGYSFGRDLSSWVLLPYKTWNRSGYDAGGNPVFTPDYDTQRFFSWYMPMNTAAEHNYGLEWELNLGRFDAIRTSFFLNGAWMHTESWSNGCTFEQKMQHGSTVNSHVGIYEPGTWRYHREKALTTLRITHNIPSIGFVVTLTTQVNFFTRNWTVYGNDLYPSRYISNDDGKVYPFTAEMAEDDAFKYMLTARSDSRFIVSHTIPTVVFNLNVSKEFKKLLTASFYVNNLFNSRPLDPSEVTKGVYTELNNPIYFGFELKLKLF